jgi:hypothetical protein
MNKSDSILSVYSDARAEYTKQLCVFLVPAYFQFFIELLEKTKQEMVNDSKKILWQFQNRLNEIHDWNMEKVNNEINHINMNCGCDYLEDLLTAVFIAHTKVLTAIRLSANNKKVDITIPKVEHFLFKVLCETSKLLWGSTYLFRDGISGVDKQQNYRMIENILNEGILQAIRSLVPVKSILRNFVNNDLESKDDDSDDDDTTTKKEVEITKDLEKHKKPQEPQEPQEKPQEPQEKPQEPQEKPQEKPQESNESSQTIVLENKPTVRFGEFNSVFDMGDPLNSDMIFDPKEDEVKELDDGKSPVITILDETESSLEDDFDFENLIKAPTESLGEDEYDEL